MEVERQCPLERREFAAPAGNLFVLGNNCDTAIASPDPFPNYSMGFVPSELMVGRVIATLGGGGA